MTILVVSFPKLENIDYLLSHHIDRWIIELADRDALECCALLENNNIECEYLPINLIYPFYNDSDTQKEEISNAIEKINPNLIIACIPYLCEGPSFAAMIAFFRFYKQYTSLNAEICAVGNFPHVFHDYLIHSGYSFAGTYSELYVYINAHYKKKIVSFSCVPDYQKLIPYIEQITFKNIGKINLYLRSSIGCPNRCVFCSTSSSEKSIKYVPLELLENELQAILNLFGNNKVSFDCIANDSFGINWENDYQYICLLIKYHVCVKYVLMRADTIISIKNYLSEIKKVSEFVLIGVENCEDTILQASKKNETFLQMIEAIVLLKKNKIKTHLNWIIGLPGETVLSVYHNLKTMIFLLRSGLADEIEPQLLTPFPWTPLANEREKYSLFITSNDPYDFNESGIKACFHYFSSTSSLFEKSFLIARYVCCSFSEKRWDVNRQSSLLNLSKGEIVTRIYDTYDDNDYKLFLQLIGEK